MLQSHSRPIVTRAGTGTVWLGLVETELQLYGIMHLMAVKTS
jgi:hypothetical protein